MRPEPGEEENRRIEAFFRFLLKVPNVQNIVLGSIELTPPRIYLLSQLPVMTYIHFQDCTLHSNDVVRLKLPYVSFGVLLDTLDDLPADQLPKSTPLALSHMISILSTCFSIESVQHLSLFLNYRMHWDLLQTRQSLPTFPNIHSLQIAGEDVYNNPYLLDFLRCSPNASKIALYGNQLDEWGHFSLTSDIMPGLKYYGGQLTALSKFAPGRPISHVKLEYAGHTDLQVQDIIEMWTGLKDSLESVEIIEENEGDFLDNLTVFNGLECTCLKTLAITQFHGTSEENFVKFFSFLSTKLPSTIRQLTLSFARPPLNMIPDWSLDLRQVFSSYLSTYETLEYFGIDGHPVFGFSQGYNPRSNRYLGEIQTIRKWREAAIGPDPERWWERFFLAAEATD